MHMKLVVLAAAGVLAAHSALAAVTDVTVNGTKISAAAQEKIIQAAMAQGQERTPQLEKDVRERLIGEQLLVDAALSQKLDKEQPVIELLAQSRSNILAGAALNRYLKNHPVTEAEIRADYDQKKAQYGATEYHVRHILTQTQKEAEDALKRIRAGEDFAKVAREVSIDNGTKDNGGDLDWASPSSMVKPFADAMKAQKVGEVSSQPVKSEFGYHILLVEATRPAELFPAYEHAKPTLRQELVQKKVFEYIESLRSKASIH